MPRIESSILIERPLAEVFAVACDYNHDTKWRKGVLEVTLSPSTAFQTGCKTREVMHLLGQRLVTEGTVTGYEPNVRVDFKSTSGPMKVLNWRIVEAVDGGTRFTYSLKTSFNGFIRLLDPLLQRIGQRQVEGDFQRLKALLETSQSASPPLRLTAS